MSLLGDLWKMNVAGVREDDRDPASLVQVQSRRPGGRLHRQDMSYVQAVSSTSSSECHSRGSGDNKGSKGPSANGKRMGASLVGVKWPRSPKEVGYGRCFRSTHSMSDCHHQVVCQRCNGVGHVVARCPMVSQRSLNQWRVHVCSKRMQPFDVPKGPVKVFSQIRQLLWSSNLKEVLDVSWSHCHFHRRFQIFKKNYRKWWLFLSSLAQLIRRVCQRFFHQSSTFRWLDPSRR